MNNDNQCGFEWMDNENQYSYEWMNNDRQYGYELHLLFLEEDLSWLN